MKNKKEKTLWKDFKAFISKGNVVDMAIGVIMGSAFGAIVTALSKILLTLCTWAVPGGVSGLITVLPAITESQKVPAIDGVIYPEILTIAEWTEMGGDAVGAAAQKLYTLHGNVYVYNSLAVLDWGVFINAIISFLVIAIVLFVILKVVSFAKAKTKRLQELQLEAYYEKHPEERPAPVEAKPVPPTELEVLTDIKNLLKANSENKKAE